MRWKRSTSLTARLTFWYSLSAIAVVSFSTLYLYWSFVRSLDFRDQQLLTDKLEAVRSLIASEPEHFEALKERIEKEWPSRTSETFFVQVTDEKNKIITRTPGAEAFFQKTEPASQTAEESPVELTQVEEHVYRTIASSVEPLLGAKHVYKIRIALERSQENSALVAYRYRLIGVLTGAMLFCVVISYQIARRGLRPIEKMASTAANITCSSLDQRMQPDQMPTELAHLAKTFNGMLDGLKDSFDRLQRFSADIAHELRTPVNNVTGGIGVALGKERSPGEYQEVLGSALEECGRLSRIIDSLLFLARAEHPEMQLVKERLAVGAETQAVLEFYEASAADAGISCHLDVHDEMTILAERTLFQRALGNLLSNALKHTARGGVIHVTASKEGALARIEVNDSGIGIPPEHLPRLLDRFYRVDQSRSKDSGGTGLGLAIVKSIVSLHGGEISLSSELGKGTAVRLSFPLTST